MISAIRSRLAGVFHAGSVTRVGCSDGLVRITSTNACDIKAGIGLKSDTGRSLCVSLRDYFMRGVTDRVRLGTGDRSPYRLAILKDRAGRDKALRHSSASELLNCRLLPYRPFECRCHRRWACNRNERIWLLLVYRLPHSQLGQTTSLYRRPMQRLHLRNVISVVYGVYLPFDVPPP